MLLTDKSKCYTLKTCFEPFPLPSQLQTASESGRAYHATRQSTLIIRKEGLTPLYNRFHDSSESSSDIQQLRELHVEMDQAVAAAYGWTDLDLGHGFHEIRQGVRFTISAPARRTVLQRLLKLNHERLAEEVKQGLHDKKGRGPGGEGRGKKKAASKPAKQEASLFDGVDD